MKSILLAPFICILLIIPEIIFSQAELVPNNSFESFTVCPVGFSEFAGKVSNWLNPNTASPDYMNACANPFPAGVPKNGVGYQVPEDGVAYAGTYTFSGTIYREFIQVQLISPLVAGETYLFSMYVVLHNKSNTAIDDLGTYFSVTAPTAAGTGMLAGAPVPQISNPFGSVITDTLNWTLVSGTYTATGGEEYLTLGHLKSDATTTYQSLPYGSQGAYYYFDDVSLMLNEILPITLTSFEAKLLDENDTRISQLIWTTESEINNCCYFIERSTDGINYSDIGKVEGSGNSSTAHNYYWNDLHPENGINYYRLRQVDFDGKSFLSETRYVINNTGEKQFWSYILNNNWQIINAGDEQGEAVLYSLNGEKLNAFSLIPGITNINPVNYGSGIYFLVIFDNRSGGIIQTITLVNIDQ